MSARYILLCAALTLSCAGPPLSRHPRVFVDSAFTADELRGVIDGLNAWHTAAPEFSFYISRESTPDLVGDALSGDYENTIYIVRNLGPHDSTCPNRNREIGDKAVGITGWYDSDQMIICMDATYVNSHGSLWKEITMHEVGHALGLPHRPMPSVMSPNYGEAADAPTPGDVAALRAVPR